MKKLLCSAVILSLVFSSCTTPNVAVDGETLNQTVAVRAAGTTFMADVTFPDGEALIWSSSYPAVAEVNQHGLVTAMRPGTTEIVATPNTCQATAQTIVLTVAIGCNLKVPAFGANLGEISFASEQTWTIGEQIWSDAVQTSVCSGREIYHGGHWGIQDFNADCRSNPDQKGDLFTWCAAIRFQDELCPAPWRVPTVADFVNLDKALGGTGENRTDATIRDLYFSNWGASFSGYCSPTGALGVQGSWAFYWALTQDGPTTGDMLVLNADGFVGPKRNSVKYRGFSLRCVRDTK